MSAAVHVPSPAQEQDSHARSRALRACLEPLLQTVIDSTDLLLVEVACPLLLDGPVSVSCPRESTSVPGTAGCRPAPSLVVRQIPIPASAHAPAGLLIVAAPEAGCLVAAQALPALIAKVIDAEAARLAAEGVARGALEIANRDPSTGLGNRRAWAQALQVECARSARSGRPLTLLILDIDGLKAVNDEHGHAAGDRLIVRTAEALDQARRATDQVCRLGGDEFGIAAPDTDHVQAQLFADRLRLALQAGDVQISLGWAVSDARPDAQALWQLADTAMYEDKRRRRA
jgi:diguanylate cyclase (GGDEF)-like protein